MASPSAGAWRVIPVQGPSSSPSSSAERAAAQKAASLQLAAKKAMEAESRRSAAAKQLRSRLAAKRIQKWWRAHLDAKYNVPPDPRIEVVDESFHIPPWRVLPDSVDNVVLDAPISAH